jgi:hypothetical protein
LTVCQCNSSSGAASLFGTCEAFLPFLPAIEKKAAAKEDAHMLIAAMQKLPAKKKQC